MNIFLRSVVKCLHPVRQFLRDSKRISIERVGEAFGPLSLALDVNLTERADLTERANVGPRTWTNVHLFANCDDPHLLD